MTEPRARRKRGSLSPDEIVAASLALLDREGESPLTFALLGRELESSPTAVYRHFASRADLLRAIADHLDGLSLRGYEPHDDWRADLEDLAWRAWNVAIAHPAAASLALGIITNGIHELRAVDAVLRALHQSGLRGREAVIYYQVYANLVLGAAQAQATRLSATGSGRDQDDWLQVYTPSDPSAYPYAEAVKTELRRVNYEEVFGKQLELFLAALALVATPS
ncbi:TetR/AcrR family transcriptional regulator [Microbacterium sp.]|uniref:TetR/AcrR family transcriptional regulator n=1 Tax=Microbacterium sp. TaxID=51671 RepID=UPI003C726620